MTVDDVTVVGDITVMDDVRVVGDITVVFEVIVEIGSVFVAVTVDVLVRVVFITE